MPDPSLDLVELPNAGWDARLRVFRSRAEVDTFALLTARYAVLVDTTSLPAISARIVELLRPALVGRGLLVVNTHADYDHAWGNGAFAPDGPFPAPIIGHEQARLRLESLAEYERLARMRATDAAFAGVRLIPPTLTFAERLTIHGGDLTLDLLHTPGHTSDHVSVWAPEPRLLLAGDAAEHPFPEVDRAEDVPLLRASLARLAALGPALVFPCHGGTTDPGLLVRNIAYFDELERHTRETLRAGALPGNWAERDDLPDVLGFSFEEATRIASMQPDAVPAFYRDFHRANARAMVGWVASLLR
jgi:glyoxylase-like metal-dependent hydrolase (beta-lactamase superfamily II)